MYEKDHAFDEFRGLESKITSVEGKQVLKMFQGQEATNRRKTTPKLLFITSDQDQSELCASLCDEFAFELRSLREILRRTADGAGGRWSGYVKKTLEKKVDIPVQLAFELVEETFHEESGRPWALVDGFPEALRHYRKQVRRYSLLNDSLLTLQQPRKPYYFIHIEQGAATASNQSRWQREIKDTEDRSIASDADRFRSVGISGASQQKIYDDVRGAIKEFLSQSA
ncbi:hypothetical protein JX265_014005 [Neoarthrinium moseri]|uniref:Uncharacterized protein n=1 Tax=Neoarthrinium moseri TaxID=1658444 RepID=A0A9P9W7K7_9PEZI|nr:hypothetical protein JX265_014005 [Neoarthrinium moseri]